MIAVALRGPGRRHVVDLPQAYTDPLTWVALNPLPATDLNTYLRDNIRWLGGADGRGTSLPASPVNGHRYNYVADATNGVEWLLVYDSTQLKWRKVGGPALFASVATEQSTSSTTYVDLTTAGPSITAPRAGSYSIEYHATVRGTAGSANDYWMSPKLGAAATSDADGDEAKIVGPSTNDQTIFSVARRVVRTLAAADLVKLQYRAASGTGNWKNRELFLDPVYVS